jgi:F-type H+-transporting ATPase subunit delta
MVSVVAARYAKAMVEVVTAPGSALAPEKATEQLRSVLNLVQTVPDLDHALRSPAVRPSRKRGVIARLAEPLGLAREVRNFLYVLIDRRRIGELEDIVEAFETLLDEALGFVRADVTSARELDAAQRASLEAQLSRLTGKRARAHFSTDPALIGGAVARVGSAVYDGSVRGQLEALRRRLRA